jgi:hypothetical protein
MGRLCIQIRPNRALGIDLNRLRNIAAHLGSTHSTNAYSEEENFDDGPRINLLFDAASTLDSWPLIYSTLYEDAGIGADLRRSSIAVCQGRIGWEDYLLLHHFDPDVSCDRLTVQKLRRSSVCRSSSKSETP